MSRENPQIFDVNILLDSLWVKEEIASEIRSHFNLNDNENIANQNVDASSAGFREKSIVLNAYIRKKENKINDLRFYLKREKEEHVKPKLRIRPKIKIRVDQ